MLSFCRHSIRAASGAARSLAFAFGSRVEVEPRAREKKMRKKS